MTFAALQAERSQSERQIHGSHYAYWQPFQIYWPHLARNRIYWSRIPWFF